MKTSPIFAVNVAITIPFARLEAEPTAERCIDCQSKLEANDHRLHLHPHSSM
jgi:hypothetical protein